MVTSERFGPPHLRSLRDSVLQGSNGHGRDDMKAPPEQVIRKYLDQNGRTEARVEHLLTSFGAAASDEKSRERTAVSLASAGVEVDRPLAGRGAGALRSAGGRLPGPLRAGLPGARVDRDPRRRRRWVRPHRRAGRCTPRVVAGSVFGASILIAHEIHGEEAAAMILVTAISPRCRNPGEPNRPEPPGARDGVPPGGGVYCPLPGV
jgi:hypothetical protein